MLLSGDLLITGQFLAGRVLGERIDLPGARQWMTFSIRLDDQLDRRPHLVVDRDVCELWHTGHENAIVPKIAGRQDERFDRLVDRAGADGLHDCSVVFTNDTGNCTGNSRGP